MKNLILITAMTLGFAMQAQATCARLDIEGDYKTTRRDSYRIIQPDCDSLILIDLNNSIRYPIDLTKPNNPIEPPTERISSDLIRLMRALKFSASARIIDSSSNNNPYLELKVKTQLPIKSSELEPGLKAPTLEFTYRVWTWSYTPWNNPQKEKDVWVSLEEVKALSGPNDSVIQKTFTQGMNLVLGLVGKFGTFWDMSSHLNSAWN